MQFFKMRKDLGLISFLLICVIWVFACTNSEAAEEYFENPDLIYEAFQDEIYYEEY